MTETNSPSPITEDYSQWLEVASLTDYITQAGNGSSLSDIKLTDLHRFLQNPYNNLPQIRKVSRYMTNKHGVLRETSRVLRSLLALNYHLSWSSFDNPKKIKKYEEKIYDFLETVVIQKVVRDGIFETTQEGSLVMCLRNKSYIQFLEIDNLRINSMVNGRWKIEVDLKTIDTQRTMQDKLAIIESLPDEVTVAKYNLYKNKGEDYRYVEIKSARIISPDAPRNYPFSLPYTFGAWNSLLQKELIDRVERSVSDRMIKQLLLLQAFPMNGKDGDKPPPKELISHYFNEVSKLLQKKNNSRNNNDESSVGLVGMPSFFELKEIKVNTDMFKKELYEKINKDVFLNLGISESLISGGSSDSNFSSAQMNNEKIFSYLFTILEQFEDVINEYIKQLLPSDLKCKFKFSRTTMLDREKTIAAYKDLFLQTGIAQYWIESVTGLPFHYALSQAQYERQVLGVDEILNPPQNFYNQSGNGGDSTSGGRPPVDNPTNPNTVKSKSNGSNGNPKPSTS